VQDFSGVTSALSLFFTRSWVFLPCNFIFCVFIHFFILL